MSAPLRKSPFGRTQLFHDDDDIVFRELQCAASVTQRTDGGVVFHTQGCGPGRACWHCCHPFDGNPVRLPRVYEPNTGTYHVYGNFCSLGCAKAHMLTLPHFNREQHSYVFKRMARDLYGVDSVQAAPPRTSLHMFGGPFSIEDFRTKTFPCTVATPPFVSYCMVIEEKLAAHPPDASTVRGMRIPSKVRVQGTSVDTNTQVREDRYRKLCESRAHAARNSTDAPPTPAVDKKRRVSEVGSSRQGGLSSFIRK